MRVVKSFPDVQKVLNELLDFKDKLTSKSWDLHGLQIKNAGPATDDNDYVIKSQLQQIINAKAPSEQFYTIVFDTTGSANDGDLTPPFIVQSGREGFPYLAWVSATNAPTTADLKCNLNVNGTDILPADLVLPQGQTGPVSTGLFIDPKPKLGTLAKVIMRIDTGGGAALVAVGLVVKRIVTS